MPQDRAEQSNQSSSVRSENNRSDLLPYIPGWDFWDFRLIERRDTSHKVPVVPPADLCPFDDLVTEIQREEDGDVDV